MSRLRIPVLLLLFAAAAAMEALRLTSLSTLTNRDIWLHLETGLWILQHHALPHNGIFSQSGDLPWSACSWAYDVLLAAAYRLLDLRAIPLLLMLSKAALAFVTFLLAGGLSDGLAPARVNTESQPHTEGKFWLAIFLSIVAQYILGAVPVGPGYCSVLLFAVELLLLIEFRRSGNFHLLYWLPALFLLWANLDVQFVYGIGLLLLFVTANYFAEWRPEEGKAPLPAVSRKTALGVVALSLLATLLTPYFYRPWTVFFSTATSAANRYFGDFHAMSFHQPQDYLLLLLTMSAFLALGRRRSRDLFSIGLLIACAALSFHSQRDVWLVTLAALAVVSTRYPVAGSQTLTAKDGARTEIPGSLASENRVLRREPTKNQRSKSRFPQGLKPASLMAFGGTAEAVPFPNSFMRLLLGTGYWVLALAIVVAVMAALIPREKMRAKLAGTYPVAAADAVRSQQLPQPIFNSYEFGGFLIWYLRDYPVAIDGRADLYGPDFMIQYSKAMNADIPYSAYPAMSQARTLLLARNSIMADALAGLPAFKVVYRDNVAVVLEKQDSSQFPVLSSQEDQGLQKDWKVATKP